MEILSFFVGLALIILALAVMFGLGKFHYTFISPDGYWRRHYGMCFLMGVSYVAVIVFVSMGSWQLGHAIIQALTK